MGGIHSRYGIYKRIDASYYGYRDDEDGILEKLEGLAEERMQDEALADWIEMEEIKKYDIYKRIDASYYGYRYDENGILEKLEGPSEERMRAEALAYRIEMEEIKKEAMMEKNIGIAVDQVIPGHGTIPLSLYYFWPRKDAWEELKVMLESKAWISRKQMVSLLNQATDIINLWQQSGGGLS